MNELLLLGFLIGFPCGVASTLVYALWRISTVTESLCDRHSCPECKKTRAANEERRHQRAFDKQLEDENL